MRDKALSGGMRFDEPPFDVTASNITSDRESGIGAWSGCRHQEAADHWDAPERRAGRRHHADRLLQGHHAAATSTRSSPICATIPPVKNQVPAPVYKVALQPPLVPNAQKQMTETDLGDKAKRGFYLATIAHCMECHTPVGPKGRDFSRLGAGGFEFKGPWGVSVSRNITSSKTKGLGAWTDEEIKRAITQGVSHDGSKLKPRWDIRSTPR